MFVLESAATLPKEGIFVIVGVLVLAALYAVLSFVKVKKKGDDIPEDEKREESQVFRPVVFVRTNRRTPGDKDHGEK